LDVEKKLAITPSTPLNIDALEFSNARLELATTRLNQLNIEKNRNLKSQKRIPSVMVNLEQREILKKKDSRRRKKIFGRTTKKIARITKKK